MISTAREALSLRLVHEVHPSVALEAALARVLNAILQCAPGAVAASKALIARARFMPAQAMVDEAAAAFAQAVSSAEGTEGTIAFLQQRKPSWAPR